MSSKILVVGHRNPDNDSIAAAVGYAHLKNALAARDGEADAVEYVPARLGPLPVESAWILEQNGFGSDPSKVQETPTGHSETWDPRTHVSAREKLL